MTKRQGATAPGTADWPLGAEEREVVTAAVKSAAWEKTASERQMKRMRGVCMVWERDTVTDDWSGRFWCECGKDAREACPLVGENLEFGP